MKHLNYSHLLYFWTVAKEGSIVKATESLHLTPQTISGQLKILEESIGEALFSRVGRGLVLTETGHLVYQYADEIFTLGAELTSRVKSGQPGMPAALTVGIVNSIPKLIASRILQPALDTELPLRLVCREGELDQLLGDLAVHQLDLILSDGPVPQGLSVKAFSHSLGSSRISFFAKKKMAHKYRESFPDSLNQAPFLLPIKNSHLRRELDDWFDQRGIAPMVVAEFEDSALMKAFGEEGIGIFPSPEVIREEIEFTYHTKQIGSLGSVKENYFAISPERKLKHPAVLHIIESARNHLFR